jgi:hypothetical protein
MPLWARSNKFFISLISGMAKKLAQNLPSFALPLFHRGLYTIIEIQVGMLGPINTKSLPRIRNMIADMAYTIAASAYAISYSG